jgi:hypothetical protein
MLERLKAFLDPRGPLGAVLSPADVYKERAGLPVSSPHVARDIDFKPVDAAALAPVRFVSVYEAKPPASRVRQVSRYIEEHWSPVYATTDSKNFQQILKASQTLVGWRIEQKARSPHCDCGQATLEQGPDGKLVHKACGRAKAPVSDDDIVEHIQSLSFAPADDFYNTFYPTIPGNDAIMTEKGPAKGGTQMTGGRREYREKTKGWVQWDAGVVRERDKAYAAEQKAWIDGVRPRVEKDSKQLLPRKLGEL